MRKLFRRAFREAKEQLAGLEDALKRKDEQAVMQLVSDAIEKFSRETQEPFAEVLLDIVNVSGQATAELFRTKLRTAATDAEIKGFRFDKTNKRAKEWASEHAAETIKGINEATRDEIREAVEAAFEEQFTVDELADRIGDIIGDDARAETIARTETMRASNQGQQELWDQATENGLLTGMEKKEWIVTPDDRLCPICEPMDGETAEMDGTFNVDGEDLDGPPAHPNCRCTLGISV